MDIGKQKGCKRPMTLKKTIEQHKYTILFSYINIRLSASAGAAWKRTWRLSDG